LSLSLSQISSDVRFRDSILCSLPEWPFLLGLFKHDCELHTQEERFSLLYYMYKQNTWLRSETWYNELLHLWLCSWNTTYSLFIATYH
jgi:hypothetical protein